MPHPSLSLLSLPQQPHPILPLSGLTLPHLDVPVPAHAEPQLDHVLEEKKKVATLPPFTPRAPHAIYTSLPSLSTPHGLSCISQIPQSRALPPLLPLLPHIHPDDLTVGLYPT